MFLIILFIILFIIFSVSIDVFTCCRIKKNSNSCNYNCLVCGEVNCQGKYCANKKVIEKLSKEIDLEKERGICNE